MFSLKLFKLCLELNFLVKCEVSVKAKLLLSLFTFFKEIFSYKSKKSSIELISKIPISYK